MFAWSTLVLIEAALLCSRRELPKLAKIFRYYYTKKYYFCSVKYIDTQYTLTLAFEDDIKALGGGIHRLAGNYAGFWSIKVSPNYRIIFRYDKGDIFDVDYIDIIK